MCQARYNGVRLGLNAPSRKADWLTKRQLILLVEGGL